MRIHSPLLLVALCWPAIIFGQEPQNATINGKITYKGIDVPFAKVMITDPITQISRTITTDTEGKFILLSLFPRPYRIKVERFGFETLEQEIRLSPEQPTTLDPSLQAEAPSGTMAFGTFRDATGKALASTKLIFQPEGAGEPKVVTTDQEGNFFVKDLQAGKYALKSAAFQDQTKTYSIELDEGGTYIKLPSEGPIPSIPFAPRRDKSGIDVIEKLFGNEGELSRWLDTLATFKKRVLSIAPIKDGTSLFVLGSLNANSKVTYTIQPEKGDLRQITMQMGATLVGVHHINSAAHLVVFSHGK